MSFFECTKFQANVWASLAVEDAKKDLFRALTYLVLARRQVGHDPNWWARVAGKAGKNGDMIFFLLAQAMNAVFFSDALSLTNWTLPQEGKDNVRHRALIYLRQTFDPFVLI